jgi:uncharacterized protein
MIEEKMAERNLILKFKAGSHAYGTSTPNSDSDYIGVFIPDESYVLGNKQCEQVQIRTNPSDSGKQNTSKDSDTVIYSLPKFIKLLTANNPTILETLYYPQNCLIFANDLGKKLLSQRELFPSTKVKWTYLGYAFTQKKALTHKKERWEALQKGLLQLDAWETEGNKTLPVRLELPSVLREDKTWGQYEKGMPIIDIRKTLRQHEAAYGYRLEDIKKFGYSCKFASHLIRLLDEGLQFLIDGRIDLPLPNNNLIRDIKLGKFTLEEILKMADDKEKLVNDAYIKSTLSHSPNLEAIEQLQIEMLKEFWGYSCEVSRY